MAILSADFINSFATIKPDTGSYSPLPVGDYVFQVSGCEEKSTRDGSGKYLKVTFDVLGPAYQGRKVFMNYNMYNRNSDAEQIGRAQLKALTLAAGLQIFRDTDELIGRRVKAHCNIQADKSGRYGDSNRLSRYEPADSATMPAMPAAAPMAAEPVDNGSFSAAFGMASPAATTGGFSFQ